MFNSEIILKDNSIVVGKKEIQISEIKGIRKYDNSYLQNISHENAIPRIELFLKNGSTVTISKRNYFKNKSSISGPANYDTFYSLLNNNWNKFDHIFDKWLEWRLLVPIAIFELLVLLLFVTNFIPFAHLHLYVFVVILVGSIIGFAWERKARKKAIRNASMHDLESNQV